MRARSPARPTSRRRSSPAGRRSGSPPTGRGCCGWPASAPTASWRPSSAPEEVGRAAWPWPRRPARGGAARRCACALYTFALPVPSRREAEDWLARRGRARSARPPPACCAGCAARASSAPPDELRATLAAHGAAGVTDAALVLPSRVPPEALDALAEAALPRRRRAGAQPRARPRGDNLVDAARGAARRGRAGRRPGGRRRRRALDVRRALGRRRRGRRGALREAGRRGAATGWRSPCATGAPGSRPSSARRALGAVPVPVDPAAGPERLAASCSTTASPPRSWCEAEAAAAGLARPRPGALDRAATPRAASPRCTPRTSAYLVYSSGSTGRPEGRDARAPRPARRASRPTRAEVLGLAPGDRCHSMARLFTSLGFGNGFFRVLGSGAHGGAVGRRPADAARACSARSRASGVTVLTRRADLLVPARPLPRAPPRSGRAGDGAAGRVLRRQPAGAGAPSACARSPGSSLIEGLGLLGVLEHRHLDPARRAASRHARAAGAGRRRSGSPTRDGRARGARASRGACGSAATPTPPATGGAWRRPASWCSAPGCGWATCSSERGRRLPPPRAAPTTSSRLTRAG